MNELDFDELDNAVNSLVSKDQSNSSDNTEPDAKISKVSQEPKSEPDTKLDIKKDRPTRLTVKPTVPATARGANRGFIDIMAPKPSLKAPPRTSPTIVPLNNVNPPVLPVQPANQLEEKEPAMPLKMPVLTVQPPKAIELPAEPVEDDEESELAELKMPQANSTPFVNADKVEKRPLGAYSEYSPDEAKPKPAAVQPKETENSSVPPELSPDMLAVESGESLPERPEPKPSISPQYKKADKAVDTTPRPVYDAQDYHPPLLEAKVERKKMAIWLKIVIVVAILVLLGVGGYLAYQFMMQTPTQ